MITTKKLKELEAKSKNLSRVMENAGKAVFEEIKKRFGLRNKNTIVFAWHGNNAGDGFVLAYYLNKEGAKVKILFLSSEERLTELAKKKYGRVKHLVKKVSKDGIEKADILVDAMLGTGVQGQIREPLASAIDLFNSSKAFKVAIDVPTGINPDTGKKANKYVRADLIVTFHDMKPGLIQFKNVGIVIREIGL